MYGDTITSSMKRAIDETNRRREIQQKYNKEHGITPKTIIKDISNTITISSKIKEENRLSEAEKKKAIEKLEKQIALAVKDLDFESAIELRDKLLALKGEKIDKSRVGKQWKRK